MSIAAQCPDCCTCPTPTTQWDSVSASVSKCGWDEFTSPSTPPKIYRSATLANFSWSWDDGTNTGTEVLNETITVGLDCASSPCDVGVSIPLSGALAGFTYWWGLLPGQTQLPIQDAILLDSVCGTDYFVNFNLNSATPVSTTPTVATYNYGFGPATLTISNEYLTSELIAQAEASLPPFDDDWDDTAGSFRNLSTDEITYTIREGRYRFRFEIPKVGSGTCYRLEWVERFIAEAGVALTSAEIVTRGVYRPTVTITGDGTGAEAVAVMASDGSLDFFRVLNPGENYTTATVTVQAAINGGTTATGTAVLSGGQLASITKTASGDYLPTGAFSGGGGSGATITFTMDATGGLATSPIGATGSGYTSEPILTITPKVSGSTAARVDLHLGTETAKCAEWDGEVPEDYDPEDPSTYPILGDGVNPYFELPVPSADGTTLTANVRAFCDCSACT